MHTPCLYHTHICESSSGHQSSPSIFIIIQLHTHTGRHPRKRACAHTHTLSVQERAARQAVILPYEHTGRASSLHTTSTGAYPNPDEAGEPRQGHLTAAATARAGVQTGCMGVHHRWVGADACMCVLRVYHAWVCSMGGWEQMRACACYVCIMHGPSCAGPLPLSELWWGIRPGGAMHIKFPDPRSLDPGFPVLCPASFFQAVAASSPPTLPPPCHVCAAMLLQAGTCPRRLLLCAWATSCT